MEPGPKVNEYQERFREALLRYQVNIHAPLVRNLCSRFSTLSISTVVRSGYTRFIFPLNVCSTRIQGDTIETNQASAAHQPSHHVLFGGIPIWSTLYKHATGSVLHQSVL